jgi:predicted GNAT family acetyltransferase
MDEISTPLIVFHCCDGDEGAWVINDSQSEKTIASLVYHLTDEGHISLDGTTVDECLRGKNAGKLMVQHAVEYARAKGRLIVPVCPFTVAVFNKTPEYNDVRAERP